MLQEETLTEIGRREYEEPNGEIIEVLKNTRNSIIVLTRVESEEVGGVDVPINPSQLTVGTLKSKIREQGSDWTDAQVQTLIESEKRGKDRKTALAALSDIN